MNWQTILSEIQAFGLSQSQVADRINKSLAWVSAVSKGKYVDLRWSDGQAMLALLSELSPTVNPENSQKQKSEAHVECCSGDPRHGERHRPELRHGDRREDDPA